MNNLQIKAIEAARKVLVEMGHGFEELEFMYIVWFCKTLQNWKALVSGPGIDEYNERSNIPNELIFDMIRKCERKLNESRII